MTLFKHKDFFLGAIIGLILASPLSLVLAVTVLPTLQGGTSVGAPNGWPANSLVATGSATTSPLVATTTPTVASINGTTTATSTFAGPFVALTVNTTSTTASSSFANGINLTHGCYSILNTCLISATSSGNGTVVSSTAGFFAFYPATAAVVQGTSTLNINTTTGAVGIATTTQPSGVALFIGGYAQSIIASTTDGATVTYDWNKGNDFSVVLAGNRTFAFSNVKVGGNITIYITQDSSGSRTVTWPATVSWKTTAPTLSTTAGATDVCWFGAATSTNTIFGSCR